MSSTPHSTRPDAVRRNLPVLGSLRGRLTLALAGLLMVQMAYLLFLWMPAGHRWAEEQATSQAREHLQTLGESLVPYLLQRQLAAVNETLDYVGEREVHWHRVMLINSKGVRVYPLSGYQSDPGSEGVLLTQPIVHNRSELAVLSLELDVQALSAEWEAQTHRLVAVMGLISLLLVILVGAIIEVLVIRPARTLQKAAAAIARGDYAARTPEGGADEIGSLAAAFADMRDEIRRQQDGLTRAKESAELANQSKSVFLATMSHEIRTPLGGIITVASMMNGLAMSPKQAELLDIIRRSANHLLAVISDILDFSKIEAGKLELDISDMRPATLAADMEHLVSPLAEARGIAFVIECGVDPDLVVRGDANRLRQVLLNLCSNAVKFTEQGSVTMASRMLGVEDGCAVLRYTVTDTGIGMSDEVRARLFDRFMQADPGHAREYGGTGLGLAISKQIVEMMDGEMNVQSEPGKGSRFWFDVRFPVVEAPSAAPQPAPGCAPQVAPAATPARLRVLAADDDEVNQFIVQNLMEMEGYECVLVENGQEALDAAQTQHFDVILMDMQMPVMDGLEATRRIRGLGGGYAAIPIIALTANAMDEARRECEAAGMSHFVTKPMDLDDMARLLGEFAGDAPRS
jgi:signal transduction histidine kinase/CheY-like chemotaxis protein